MSGENSIIKKKIVMIFFSAHTFFLEEKVKHKLILLKKLSETVGLHAHVAKERCLGEGTWELDCPPIGLSENLFFRNVVHM